MRYLLQPKYPPQCILYIFIVIWQMATIKDGESMNTLFLMAHLYIVLPHSHVLFGIILNAPNLGALYELFSFLSQFRGFGGYELTCEFRMHSTGRGTALAVDTIYIKAALNN